MSKFEYLPFVSNIAKYKITHLQVAPPILIMLSKRYEEHKGLNLSSLCNILCGAAPLSKELQNAISHRYGCNVVQGWGMTEVTCGAIRVPGGHRDDSGSVGNALPNTDLRLVDDDGRDVPENTPGELYVKGPQVCLGYWRNEKATADTFDRHGWLKTGDVAVIRDGWVWIVDRKKELIKVNAFQVAPAELEAILLENEDVSDAAVVGITLHDEERPRAYVVKRTSALSAEDVQAWVSQRVAKHKRLTGGVSFVPEVPRLASGKVVRKVVKEWAKRDAQHEKARPRL